MSEPIVTEEMLTAAVVALARKNVPTDTQGLLLRGYDKLNCQPGALKAAISAAIAAQRTSSGGGIGPF